ncbi:unnamed protein product [Bursaphelenchus okinawaensis]|uniref:CAAX prenyl protease n=1 Tax=Bursaphelenchus okinawaensis TaxID=465554 RepID=A0A811JSZ9_9BILA|nr:unnamed protein product [Bursaphelenchus okinawaensis]CAG9082327.1 unnamed protein product [Bursaphelenchus okinawaensis]
MNPSTIFYSIYSFNLAVFFWELYLSFRQYRLFRDTEKRPDHVSEIIDEADYDKARLYKLAKLRFGFVRDTIGKIISSVVLFANIMPLFWESSGNATEAIYGESEIIQSFLFTIYSSVFGIIVGLPFGIYENFVIEEQFGFNKQTVQFYLVDKLKKFAVTTVISIPLISILIWIVNAGGEYFFVYVWIFVSLVIFVMMTIYPEYIAPLFDKFTPLPDSELKTKIEKLAASVEFPLTKLYVVEGSKRSSHSNAYMYGFWKNKRIVLYDTLLSEEMNQLLKETQAEEKKPEKEEEKKELKKPEKRLGMKDDEVVAVLGHELGHWKLSHTLSNLAIAEVNLFLILVVFSYFYKSNNIYLAFGYKAPAVLIGLTLITEYVLSAYNEIISVAMSFLSRYMEFSADRFSAKLGYTDLLCSSLIKLGKDNLSMPIDDPLYSLVHHSHPPIIERIAALKKTQ